MRSVVAWDLRTAEFRWLRLFNDGRTIPVMELAPPVPSERTDAWRRTCELWLELEPHPNLLDAVDRVGDVLLLRYAAIDWRRTKPMMVNHSTVEVFAWWGA
jgi:hypothetical protein